MRKERGGQRVQGGARACPQAGMGAEKEQRVGEAKSGRMVSRIQSRVQASSLCDLGQASPTLSLKIFLGKLEIIMPVTQGYVGLGDGGPGGGGAGHPLGHGEDPGACGGGAGGVPGPGAPFP